MQRQQPGFTLIELVIVIVILGILSAFALPRFADLGSDARIAALEGAEGAIKSSAAIVRSKCLADSDCDVNSTGGETINLEGSDIELVLGYPEATADGIMEAAQLTEDFTIDSGSGSGAGRSIDIIPNDVTSGNACNIEYTAATAPGGSSSTSPPTTSIDDGDC